MANVLLSCRWFLPKVGGIQNYVLNVGRVLIGQGHKVTVLTCRHEPGLPSREILEGMQVARYSAAGWGAPLGLANPAVDLWLAQRAYAELMRKSTYDWVWARDPYVGYAAVRWRGGPPCVYIQAQTVVPVLPAARRVAQDRLLWELYSRVDAAVRAAILRCAERRVLSDACARVVLSQAKRTEIAQAYQMAEDRFEVIAPGVDTGRYTPASAQGRRALRERFGLACDAFVFLFVGRPSPEKGIGLLLEAFGDVRAERSVHLMLVGPKPGDLELGDLDPGVRWRIHPVGPVPEPVCYYQAADAMVLPSLSEGFGQVLLEAMATGLPCIAFRPPSGTCLLASEEVLHDGETGLLVPYRSVDGLAAAMSRLAGDDRLAASIGRAAREHVKGAYSWERVVRTLKAVTGMPRLCVRR